MKVEREEILQALAEVKPGLASKEFIEQSLSFIFSGDSVFTFNDEVAISRTFPKGLTGAVPAQELFGLLTKSQAKEVELTSTKQELKIAAGRSRSGISINTKIGEAAQAAIDASQKRKRWHTLPEDFVEGIKMCAFSASHVSTNPKMSAIHLNGDRIESCDNQRMTRFYFAETPERTPLFSPAILIPVRSMELIINYQPTDFAFEDGWVYFKNTEGVILSLRTIADEVYPDLNPFIDDAKGIEVNVPADKIIAILKTAGVFAGDQDDVPKVTIKLANDWLAIEAKNSTGWFKDEVRTKYKDTPIEFIVNPTFLIDILERFTVMTITERTLHFSAEEFVHVCSYGKPEEPKVPKEVTDLEPF